MAYGPPHDPKNRFGSPYAPRSTERLEGLRRGLEGEDLEMPTEEEILAAQGNPTELENLLAKARAAQSLIDRTRGRSYAMDGGHGNVVANPLQAVADMFIRGNAAKDRDNANKSAEEISRSQQAAEAALRRKESAYGRSKDIEAELARIEELNRGDAQEEASERTRVSEREQDRSDKALRDQLDESYRQAELAERKRAAMAGEQIDRERWSAEKNGLNAKDQLELQQAAKSKQDAYNTWGTASSQYLEAHKNSGWGPGVGGNYGLRSGARANLAPVLKGIFRQTGEGTFTDKDQELLMDMVPTSFDSDEAAAKKLQNIDNIIRSKLGMSGPEDPNLDPVEAELRKRGL